MGVGGRGPGVVILELKFHYALHHGSKIINEERAGAVEGYCFKLKLYYACTTEAK